MYNYKRLFRTKTHVYYFVTFNGNRVDEIHLSGFDPLLYDPQKLHFGILNWSSPSGLLKYLMLFCGKRASGFARSKRA